LQRLLEDAAMPTIEVALPEDVLTALRKSPAEVARDVRVAAAAEWYAEGLVSQGTGAELAGLSRPEFLDELAKRRVPVIQMTVEELRAELAGE
jgi:predicted HTH domain antitoxin